MIAIVTLSVDLLTILVGAIVWKLDVNLYAFSQFPVNIAYRFAQAKQTN